MSGSLQARVAKLETKIYERGPWASDKEFEAFEASVTVEELQERIVELRASIAIEESRSGALPPSRREDDRVRYMSNRELLTLLYDSIVAQRLRKQSAGQDVRVNHAHD